MQQSPSHWYVLFAEVSRVFCLFVCVFLKEPTGLISGILLYPLLLVLLVFRVCEFGNQCRLTDESASLMLFVCSECYLILGVVVRLHYSKSSYFFLGNRIGVFVCWFVCCCCFPPSSVSVQLCQRRGVGGRRWHTFLNRSHEGKMFFCSQCILKRRSVTFWERKSCFVLAKLSYNRVCLFVCLLFFFFLYATCTSETKKTQGKGFCFCLFVCLFVFVLFCLLLVVVLFCFVCLFGFWFFVFVLFCFVFWRGGRGGGAVL